MALVGGVGGQPGHAEDAERGRDGHAGRHRDRVDLVGRQDRMRPPPGLGQHLGADGEVRRAGVDHDADGAPGHHVTGADRRVVQVAGRQQRPQVRVQRERIGADQHLAVGEAGQWHVADGEVCCGRDPVRSRDDGHRPGGLRQNSHDDIIYG